MLAWVGQQLPFEERFLLDTLAELERLGYSRGAVLARLGGTLPKEPILQNLQDAAVHWGRHGPELSPSTMALAISRLMGVAT